MGRPARVTAEEAVRVVEKYMEHFRTNDMPPSGSSVWREMSKDLDKKWTPHTVYTSVRENKKDILSIARSNLGILVPVIKKREITSAAGTVSSSSEEEEEEIQRIPVMKSRASVPSRTLMSWYFLSIDGEIWDRVKPENTFESGEKLEKYKITSPNEWTDTIFDAFFEAFHFPCLYILKQAKVYNSQESLHYMQIYGECKSRKCSNRFFGYVEDEPRAGEALEIHIKTWDTSRDNHETVRRPIRSLKRPVVDGEYTLDGRNNGKRRAGDKSNNRDNVESEEITIIKRLVRMAEQDESIRGIGLFPSLYAIYTTRRQIQAFNDYCLREWTSVKIDMRKGFVRKINRGRNVKTNDIFLMSMVVNYCGGKTFLVHQMISETADYLSIRHWLETWVEKGASKPKEAVSNYCRVSLAAMCLTFNGFSLERYIASQFASVSGSESPDYEWQITAPSTFIRIDVSNVIHLTSQWRCFEKVHHPRIREFYIRCIDLLINARSFDEFTDLLSSTIITAVSLYEDDLLKIQQLTSKAIRHRLDSIIATNGKTIAIPIFDRESHFEREQPVLNDFLIHKDELTSVTLWMNEIVKEAKLLQKQGSEVNAFYLPEFADHLAALALDFPLWTKFTTPVEQTSTWHIEEYFQDWEPRILAQVSPVKQFPLRADRFVKAHLKEINESVTSFESLLHQSIVDQVSVDGNLRIKYSGSHVEVTLLHENNENSFTEYLDFENNDTDTSKT